MNLNSDKIKVAGEYAKEVILLIFWVIIILSIFVPNAVDVWLPAGFTQ